LTTSFQGRHTERQIYITIFDQYRVYIVSNLNPDTESSLMRIHK